MIGAMDWRDSYLAWLKSDILGGSCIELQAEAGVSTVGAVTGGKGEGLENWNDLKTEPLLLEWTMVHPCDALLDLKFRVRFGWSPLDRWRSRLRIRLRFVGLLRSGLPRT
jgi:hypothetical protein